MRSSSKNGLPIKPDVDKLSSQNIVCIYGEDDKESLCPTLSGPHTSTLMLQGAHHFDGGYDNLATIVLKRLP
jgi:type IV secretory pathway VirJ component